MDEKRTHADVAAEFGVSRQLVTKLLGRYRTEGEAGLEPKSRRPNRSPHQHSEETTRLITRLRVELTSKGLDGGPETIRWHLDNHHDTKVSLSTIKRRLRQAGLVEPQPKKRSRSSYIRFQADLPNGCWQSDVTHYHLGQPRQDQTNRAEILTWLDDHSRLCLSLTAHLPVNVETVVKTLENTGQTHGLPASILTDNGLIYTTRFAGGKGGKNKLETYCVNNHIDQKHGRPHKPTTQGKVERFQQTMKKWLTAQPAQPTTLKGLQALLDEFRDYYNNHRPHSSIKRRPPTVAYHALPKDQPTTKPKPHYRIRYDHVDQYGKTTLRNNGRLHHIGIGRQHAGTPITMLINGHNIRIINTQTGQQIRKLELDPTQNYQPQTKKK